MLIFNGKMEFVYLGNSDEFKKLFCKYLLSQAGIWHIYSCGRRQTNKPGQNCMLQG